MGDEGAWEPEARLEVANCGQSDRVSFEFVCPAKWEEMETSDDPRRRLCELCDQVVHRCHDANEAALRAEQGECIAVPGWLVEGVRRSSPTGHLIIGQGKTLRRRIVEVVEARLAKDVEG